MRVIHGLILVCLHIAGCSPSSELMTEMTDDVISDYGMDQTTIADATPDDRMDQTTTAETTPDLDVDMISDGVSSLADMSVDESLDMQPDAESDEGPEPSNLAGDWVRHDGYVGIRYRPLEPLYAVMGVDVKISDQDGAQVDRYSDVRTHAQRSHEGAPHQWFTALLPDHEPAQVEVRLIDTEGSPKGWQTLERVEPELIELNERCVLTDPFRRCRDDLICARQSREAEELSYCLANTPPAQLSGQAHYNPETQSYGVKLSGQLERGRALDYAVLTLYNSAQELIAEEIIEGYLPMKTIQDAQGRFEVSWSAPWLKLDRGQRFAPAPSLLELRLVDDAGQQSEPLSLTFSPPLSGDLGDHCDAQAALTSCRSPLVCHGRCADPEPLQRECDEGVTPYIIDITDPVDGMRYTREGDLRDASLQALPWCSTVGATDVYQVTSSVSGWFVFYVESESVDLEISKRTHCSYPLYESTCSLGAERCRGATNVYVQLEAGESQYITVGSLWGQTPQRYTLTYATYILGDEVDLFLFCE